MIQIFALREYFDQKNQKTKKAMRLLPYRIESVEDVFKGKRSHLTNIPETEPFNIYFTLANCLENGEERKIDKQHFISFDLDYINVEKHQEYISPTCEVLGVKKENCLILMSGHGLQIHIKIKNPITNEAYFKDNRKYYNRICEKINKKLKELDLPGKADTTMFAPAKLVRFPNTINRKKDRPDVEGFIINDKCKETNFNLIECSGLIDVPAKSQTKFFYTPDTKEILRGCSFLKWARQNQQSVTQEDWYKVASIVPRLYGEKDPEALSKGQELFHEFSNLHPDYCRDETDELIERAMASSFPRTCENIEQSFDCKTCKHYGKVKSPILIKGEEYIRSKETGFRKIKAVTEKGTQVTGKPHYIDLAKYYGQNHTFINDEEVPITYLFKDNYWQETSKRKIKAFAEKHIDKGKPIETERQEFFNLLTIQNLKPRSFFETSIEGLVNFKNGILNTETNAFIDHSPKFGFCSILPYDYDKNAESPRFEKFLNEVTLDRRDLKTSILEFIGYGLTNENPSWGEKAMLLFGDGANGKSVLTDIVKALAGDENCSNVSLGDLKDPKNRLLIKDKMFNLSQETSSKALIQSESVKNIISGENVTIHKFHVGMFDMKPRAKIIAACNQLPKTYDTTWGLMRKLIIIPFDATFSEKDMDRGLRKKLLEELPGIFNMCVDAFKLAKRKGRFTIAQESLDEIHDFKLANDPIAAWVEENITDAGPEEFLPTASIYEKFEINLKERHKFVPSLIGFSRKIKIILNKKGKFYKRVREDGKQVRAYYGIKFTQDEAM